jgi:WS/DGAT/MGAT family acyltransferase
MTNTAENRDLGCLRSAAVSRVPVADLCCLWAETDATPMNIALVGTFDAATLVDDDGEVSLGLIRACIAAHLDQAPMLRRVLRRTRPGQGRAVWIDAPDFSIDEHVVLAEPGRAFTDEQAFLDWCAHETLRPFHRSRPLWRISIVPGLPDRRLGFLVVVHHVVADGLRGVEMIAGLLDVTAADSGSRPAPWRATPPPTAPELIRDNLHARAATVRSLRTARLRRRLAALRGLRAEIPTRAPATVLTGEIGYGRQLVVVREALEDMRAAAHTLGCTINDLLLAAVTQGLREMLRARGHCGEAMVLRASVPVGEANGRASGMITVTLPVGIYDPDDRLRHIVAETSRRKQSPNEGVAGIVSMPASLARLGVLWARHTAATHINLYVTNVPGPRFPLYLAGAQLHDVVPLAPLVAGVRLSVTALSYDGTLSVALLADEAVTDFPVMAAGVRSAFDTYRSQGGVTPHPAAPGLSDTGGQHADPPPSVRAGLPAQPESDLIPQATGQTPGEW